ncbi:MAG: hypothetical protein ACNA7Q_12705 [Rhodobacterales bacterium]
MPNISSACGLTWPPSQAWTSAALVLAGVLALSGCNQFPELDKRLTDADKAAKFPALVPAEFILSGVDMVLIQPETQTTIEDRITALDRRADGLRATGFDPDTRARMQGGVALPPP